MPSRIHQTLSWERPWMPHEGKGTPLSFRTARGRANCERIPPDAVAGRELSLEVGGPEIVRSLRGWGNDPGMLMGSAPPALLDQAFPGGELPRRAHRGPVLLGDLRMRGP